VRSKEGTGFRRPDIVTDQSGRGLPRPATSRPVLTAWVITLAVVLSGNGAVEAQERALRLLTFEGYAEDAWVEEFETAHNAKVEITYAGSVDDMFTRMKASDGADYDLISIDTSLFPLYIAEGLIAPFEIAQIPNAANLLPPFRDIDDLQHDGQTYGVPIAWGSLGLIYDSHEIDPPPSSWEVLWDESYKGRIIVFDDIGNNILNTAIVLGFEDPFNLTDEQLAAVKQKLIDQKKVLLGYFAEFDEGNEIWASGEPVLMFSMGEFQAAHLKSRGYNVGYVIPDEGGVGWLDAWALSAGVRDAELAHAWADFFLDGSIGEQISRHYGYGSTTSRTEGLDYADRLTWFRPDEDFARRAEIWEEVKATPVP
jgi:putative spermidine/putrescine transport system substrate-binding protein